MQISSSAFALNLDLSANTQNGASYGSVGVSDTAWAASVGFNNSKVENADDTEDTATNIAIQVNGINALDSNLDLTYGVKYTLTSGEDEAIVNNTKTTSEHDGTNTLGLFVGVKTALTDSLSLTANYFPYQVQTIKTKGSDDETKTTSLGGAVQVRATYSLPL